ncbi:2,5-dichloro-2,5-cyclohexadiene-1,4-diol dehydrogenase [Candidatus Rubidus massiliensis]|nr:2,5-dichloro-2,5-cyclohexadiene-1,4-diol dehydrogenase [Candidatus Rubidus massiliensis]
MQKIYAIFGVTGGIGAVVAKHLSYAGHKVYLMARNEQNLKKISLELNQPYMVVDATNEDAVLSAFNQIKINGALDGVVSLIGSVFIKPIHLTSLIEFEEVIKINVTTSFCILKHALSIMSKGSIVLSSSTAALIGLASHEAIAAAKAAIIGLVRSAAASYAKNEIRINAVAPGLTRTPLTESITNNPLALKASTSFHPLGRIAEPEDVASAILWLLSEDSSFVTGDVIRVDGGLSSIKLKDRNL